MKLPNPTETSVFHLLLTLLLAITPLTIHAENSNLKNVATSPKASQIIFTNLNKLHADTFSLNKNNELKITSKQLSQPMSCALDQILTIRLPNNKVTPPPEHQAFVKLYPRFRESQGDTLPCAIKSISRNKIQLDPFYGKVIEANPNLVQSINISPVSGLYYHGPRNLNEWAQSDEDSWSFNRGAIISHQDSSIGYDMKLQQKSHVSFDVHWKKSLRFSVYLYTDNIASSAPKACYALHFNRNYAYLKTLGKKAKKNKPIDNTSSKWRQIETPKNDTHAHIDLFTDKTTGLITLFIDGIHEGEFLSRNPNPTDLGTGLSFATEKKYPIQLSNISSRPWDGIAVPPLTRVAQNPNAVSIPQAHLNSGRSISFEACEVKKQHIILNPNTKPLTIKIQDLCFITTGGKKEEPKKYAGDIRAWFHQGGFITLKLTSLKDGTLKGFSQAFGDVSLKLSAFNQIDFHIYDQKANELRKEIK